MKIAIIAGSNKEHSTSTKLCYYIKRQLELQDCEVALFDLCQKPLPFFKPNAGGLVDANVTELKKLVFDAKAVVLSTPEYHGAVSGILKNALDYLSFEHFDFKAVLSVSSTGGAVGVSSLQQLQTIVRNVHGVNCPEWISIGSDQRTFNAEGEPDSLKIRERTLKVLNYFLFLAGSLKKSE